MTLSYDYIKRCAAEAGFTLCGVARARVLAEHADRFEAGLAVSGTHALHYLVDRPERRLSPNHLVPNAKTVIVCAVNYRNDYSLGYPEGFANPKVCSFSITGIYQPKIKNMLNGMLARLQTDSPGVTGRSFSDTSAILEKAWAAEAGLGFIGRNSLLVNHIFGSFMLLGELIVDAECDRYDERYKGVGCGDCTRCVDACPKGALALQEKTVDTGECISALTLGPDRDLPPEEFCGWICGCDLCQNVCPYNRARPMHTNPVFDPMFDPADYSAERWREMSQDEFDSTFGKTPLNLIGLPRIKKMLSPKK